MGLVQYFTACTLDGFIADADHSLSWLFEVGHPDPDPVFDDFYAGVGALCMGSSTYEWIIRHEDLREHPEKGAEFYPGLPCFVFTTRERWAIPNADIRFVSGDVRPVHAALRAAAGERDVWIVGGGDLVGQFDDAGLLQQIRLGICPVTLGSGAPLLPRRITSERLRVRSTEMRGQRIDVVLDVLPSVDR